MDVFERGGFHGIVYNGNEYIAVIYPNTAAKIR